MVGESGHFGQVLFLSRGSCAMRLTSALILPSPFVILILSVSSCSLGFGVQLARYLETRSPFITRVTCDLSEPFFFLGSYMTVVMH